jgi:TonB family protein
VSIDRPRTLAFWLALVLLACPNLPPATSPGSSGTRFPNASEIEIMRADDSLPRPTVLDRGPRYPVSLRNRHIQGQLVAAFVIDTAGRVEAQSISFVEPGSHREFQQSVCKFLREEARFIPGRSDGRPRRTLVFMPFTFTLSIFGPPVDTPPGVNVKAYQERARELPRDRLVAELESRPQC